VSQVGKAREGSGLFFLTLIILSDTQLRRPSICIIIVIDCGGGMNGGLRQRERPMGSLSVQGTVSDSGKMLNYPLQVWCLEQLVQGVIGNTHTEIM